MPPKKWPTNSLKVQACGLRKQGMTDEQIYQRFIDEGKMVQPTAKNQPPASEKQKTMDQINSSLHNPSASRDETEKVISITEDVWEKYLVRLVNECDASPSIAGQIRDFLDKKGAIQAKKQTALPIASEEHALEFSDQDTAVRP